MKKLLKASTVLALMSPFIALAQPIQQIPRAGQADLAKPGGVVTPVYGTENALTILLKKISYWLVIVATIVIAIGLITFLWGVVQYITAGADEEKRGQARNLMIYGIIGLFVMVAVWGLVYFVGGLIGVTPGGGVDLPGVPAVLN